MVSADSVTVTGLMHSGRTTWWQEPMVEEVLHLVVHRKWRRGDQRPGVTFKGLLPMTYFFQPDPTS
jgi:hypothetical protein